MPDTTTIRQIAERAGVNVAAVVPSRPPGDDGRRAEGQASPDGARRGGSRDELHT